ncbi:MAG: NAD(P)H-binding protein [Deltaproteobacteria bacterium]|nr:NAD(P)H-binding protein [Deltaproteobacteria bacterium]
MKRHRGMFLGYREVLVTGGTGFLGRAVCRALRDRGWLPRVMARPDFGDRIPAGVPNGCRVTLGDIRDGESVWNAARSTDAVVHLAGIFRERPAEGSTFDPIHRLGTRNAIEAARAWGIDRFVHIGVAGAGPDAPTAFLRSKGSGEELVRRSGLRYTIFRPSILRGRGSVLEASLARAVRSSRWLPMAGGGELQCRPLEVETLAEAVASCLDRDDPPGAVFDLEGPATVALTDLLGQAATEAGRTLRLLRGTAPASRAFARILTGAHPFPAGVEPLDSLLDRSTHQGRGLQ